MASPVDTTVKHFHSDMAGAPVLSSSPGTLVGILDACLVSGFGLCTATSLTVAGGVATLAYTGTCPNNTDVVVLVAGVTGTYAAALNGEQKVTGQASGVLRFATAAPDGTATGAITVKMAPAGWECPFAGTNLAVYRSPLAESTRMFLQVTDTTFEFARMRGFEQMTSATDGVGPFPADGTPTTRPGGVNKSSVPSGTAPVAWTLAATAKSVILNITGYAASNPNATEGTTVFFGDFEALALAGDPYAFLVPGGTASSGYSDPSGSCDSALIFNNFTPRAHHGVGAPQGMGFKPLTGASGSVSGRDSTFGDFPSPFDGSLVLSRRAVVQSTLSAPRGYLPGIYSCPQNNLAGYFKPRQTQKADASLQGRTLLALGIGSGSSTTAHGVSFVDITGPWGA